ncbi:hypothetical protein LINPERPRIM_LOCUS2668 [Linum perenne]
MVVLTKGGNTTADSSLLRLFRSGRCYREKEK